MKISDIHKEGASLKWNAPLDDGGQPIEHYVIEKMDMDTGRWVPAGRTKDSHIKLDNLTPGQEYKFRVMAVNAEGESAPLDAEQTIIAKNPFDESTAPGQPEATDWDKDHVDLKWTKPVSDGGAPIQAYVIEKREKGTGKWLKAAEIPANVADSSGNDECKGTVPNLDENTEYEFRVRAINAAGPSEPSKASKSVITKPRKCNKNQNHTHTHSLMFFFFFL